MERSSGVLLSVTSLPGSYGIGTFGRSAYEFADFLEKAGQRCWQILPLGPTSYGDSPYQSFSSFAGNPYLIDLDMLIEDGLLTKEEVENREWGTNPRYVDYGKIYENRFAVLKLAADRGLVRDREAVDAFVRENERWLPDYALFMACKRHNGMRAWTEWPEDIRKRHWDALQRCREEHREDIEFFTYIQFLFYKQWNKLRDYIHGKGIKIIGDVPIYVAMDSCDVWAETHFFQLDGDNIPLEVAGVPPDYFSEDGQLWGNPLYDWEAMKNDGYGWWIRRIDGAAKLYDIIRIDHFRGFDTYWSVPYGDKTAKGGHWNKGPGMSLIGALKGWFPGLEFIAEDLGAPMDSVVKLLKESGWPGMKVLEFAFDPKEPSNYLPHNHVPNCICYTATHDNCPLMQWKEDADEKSVAFAEKYLSIREDEGFNWGVIRGGMGSVAKLFVGLMQDYLGLGRGHTMNNPGIAAGNWQWRLLPGEASDELAAKMLDMTATYERIELPKTEDDEPDENFLRQQKYNADWKFEN